MNPDPCVSITIPADVRYVRPVRLALGAVASLVGFDVEAIEDLRIAVDELSSALIEIGDGGEVRFDIRPEPERGVRVDATVGRGAAEIDEDRFRFSERILDAVTDSHGLKIDGLVARGWLERSPGR